MSEAENGEQQEPTMEEILASIRRIISEDEVEGDAGDDAEVVADDADVVDADKIEIAADEDMDQDDIDDIMNATDAGSDEVELVDEEDVLELTEVVDDGDPASDLDTPMEEIGDDEIDVFDATPEPQPIARAPEPRNDNEGLISDNPAAETTTIFSHYTDALSMARGVPIGNPNKSLEDIVKELLRPMLREWLDENLPPLVERLVEREINRLAGQGEKD